MAFPPSLSSPLVPRWLRQIGGSAWCLVGAGLALWGLAELAQKLTVAIVPVLVAMLLTGVLHPLVARGDDGRWPDWLAPFIAVLGILLVVVALVAGVGVRLNDQLPALQEDLRSAAEDIEQRFGLELPSPGGSSSGSGGVVPQASELLRLGGEILFGFFLTLALTFLFLKDGEGMWRWFVGLIGPSARDDVDAAGRAAWSTVGAYVRSLSIVAAFDALGVGVGLLLLGVPLVLTLATLQFVASYIPTIGAFVAGGIAVAVAYSSGGLTTAALTLALIIVVQQIGNDVIEPWVMGRSIPLHPAVILIAVTVGGALWGIAGALLLVPLSAALSAAGHALATRRLPGSDSGSGSGSVQTASDQ